MDRTGAVYLSDSQTGKVLRLAAEGGRAAFVGPASFPLGAPRGLAVHLPAAQRKREQLETFKRPFACKQEQLETVLRTLT